MNSMVAPRDCGAGRGEAEGIYAIVEKNYRLMEMV
jgi:hypothetical protein